jgi:hypothetical protein
MGVTVEDTKLAKKLGVMLVQKGPPKVGSSSRRLLLFEIWTYKQRKARETLERVRDMHICSVFLMFPTLTMIRLSFSFLF